MSNDNPAGDTGGKRTGEQLWAPLQINGPGLKVLHDSEKLGTIKDKWMPDQLLTISPLVTQALQQVWDSLIKEEQSKLSKHKLGQKQK